jgi:multiple sugar transport system substrate-binding protein
MKANVKKVVVLLLVFVLAFGVAACGSKETAGGSDGPVKLRLLSHYVAQNEEFLKPYIDQWNKENPDIQIVLEGVEFMELLPTIMTKQTSGQGADIIHIYSLWAGQLDKNGVLAKAPKDVVKDIEKNYPKNVTKGASVNGDVYGWPTEVQAFALYYNKKLLKDAGFDNPPATWNEMLSMAKAINKKDDSGKTLTQGFGFIRAWPAIVYHPFVALMNTAGGTFIDDKGKVNLDSEAAKKTMDLYSQVYGKNGISDIGFDVMKAFGSGQQGMAINAGWWLGSLKSVMADKYQDVGVAPIPSPDGKTKGSVSYVWAWGVNKKSKNQEAAWKFLTWFNSQEIKNGMTAQGNFLLEAFNTISTRESDQQSAAIQEKIKGDPNVKVLVDAIQYATPEPNPATGAEIQDTLFKQIDSVWTDQTTPAKALEAAQQAIQEKLKQ